ncbi:hypothetical protein BDF22DRAFT_666709 [Syncephalis plumigaleata]|nr:hypothetical protein BDF22DRAFT_666709 [Syncephalis plumigaleata]
MALAAIIATSIMMTRTSHHCFYFTTFIYLSIYLSYFINLYLCHVSLFIDCRLVDNHYYCLLIIMNIYKTPVFCFPAPPFGKDWGDSDNHRG